MVDRVAAGDVELAHELATAATRAALPHAGGEVRYRSKSDGTPVSDADLAAEHAMLTLLVQYRPADAVISEERGAIGAGARRWILDPIDGTAPFVAGGDEWGTHVALEVDGEIVLGIITRPMRGQRWWAARGHGAFSDVDHDPFGCSTRLATSDVSSLDGASHILDLVEGRIDGIVSERCGFLWDHAPAVVLTSEAGGRFSDPNGGLRADLQGGIYSNAALHEHLDRFVDDRAIELAGSSS